MMTITPNGPPAMPTLLSRWLGFLLLIGFFVAYLAGHTVPPGAYYLQVFRVVGTAAFLAYGFGTISNAIWKGQTLTFTIKEVIDGLVYALLTAGTFGWLWPRYRKNVGRTHSPPPVMSQTHRAARRLGLSRAEASGTIAA